MEYLLVPLVVAILIVLIRSRNDTTSRLTILDKKIDSLQTELKKYRERADIQRPADSPVAQRPVPSPIPDIRLAPAPPPVPVQQPETAFPKPPVEKKEDVIKVPQTITPRPPVPAKPKRPSFLERNPDLEKFIGENLANKIGIGVLVLGIGFFVKYAIDQEWIGEIGRVFIGILCSGILLGVAHKLRKTFAPFSSVLVGGGIAVLYLTIAIAFHEYHMFSQPVAFVIMVIITAFAVVFSLAYDRVELAVLSILGGFASPFMVSTGSGNYIGLFTYILILDVGMLVLAYYKKWNLVTIVSYASTIILFGGWLGTMTDWDTKAVVGGMIFATLFYLIFFAMSIINNLKERAKFKAIEISILLSNTFFYFGAGLSILDNSTGPDLKGLFTALLGVFNFVFAYSLYKSNRVDRNLVFMLIGLVLTFISLAAPVQLEGNYITLFWAAETVLVLWLSQKSGIRIMKLSSIILMVLMVFSLLMDWTQIYEDYENTLTIILNKGYITSLFSLAAIALTIVLLKNEKSERADIVQNYRLTLLCAGVLVLYVSQLLELRFQLFTHDFDYATQNVIIGAYNMLFIVGLLLGQQKWANTRVLNQVFIGWGAVVMLAYPVFYHIENIEVRDNMLLNNASATGFIFHYLLMGLAVAVAIITLRRMRKETEINERTSNAYIWIYAIFFLFVASAELDHLMLVLLGATEDNMDHILTQNHKIGFPILWGLASFVLIFMGLKRKNKHIRIVSLTLFLVTLLKLFIIDIRGISEGGKIAAFISLGVLLLTVSFMYQRLKRLLLADESNKSNEA